MAHARGIATWPIEALDQSVLRPGRCPDLGKMIGIVGVAACAARAGWGPPVVTNTPSLGCEPDQPPVPANDRTGLPRPRYSIVQIFAFDVAGFA